MIAEFDWGNRQVQISQALYKIYIYLLFKVDSKNGKAFSERQINK